MRKNKGITLIALIITIVVLIILAGVAINLSLGDNGIFKKAKTASEETTKQAATEKINLKITNIQMEEYTKTQSMPTLQKLADNLCEDNEVQYVATASKVANSDKVIIGDASSIFTKLKNYNYEFEINSQLQLASVDGIKIATSNDETINQLQEQINILQQKVNNMETASPKIFVDWDNLLTTMTTRGATWTATEDCAITGYIQTNDLYTACVYVDNNYIWGLSTGNVSSDMAQVVYVKKGSIITTRADHGNYNLKIYGLK